MMKGLKIKKSTSCVSLCSTTSSDCDEIKTLSKRRKLSEISEERNECATPAFGLSPRDITLSDISSIDLIKVSSVISLDSNKSDSTSLCSTKSSSSLSCNSTSLCSLESQTCDSKEVLSKIKKRKSFE